MKNVFTHVLIFTILKKEISSLSRPTHDIKSSSKETNSQLSKWKFHALECDGVDRRMILFTKLYQFKWSIIFHCHRYSTYCGISSLCEQWLVMFSLCEKKKKKQNERNIIQLKQDYSSSLYYLFIYTGVIVIQLSREWYKEVGVHVTLYRITLEIKW